MHPDWGQCTQLTVCGGLTPWRWCNCEHLHIISVFWWNKYTIQLLCYYMNSWSLDINLNRCFDISNFYSTLPQNKLIFYWNVSSFYCYFCNWLISLMLPFSGKIIQHVPMMKRSDLWQVCIVALTSTCLWARNFQEELQMVHIGMRRFCKGLMAYSKWGPEHILIFKN